MNRRTPSLLLLIATTGLLAGCARPGAQPTATTVCDLPQNAQRLVRLQAEVGVRSDGHAVISDANCPSKRYELRLTGVAARSGLEPQLQAAPTDAAGARHLPVIVTGVYDGGFTAETLQVLAAKQP
jgi:hypothetical protein